MRVITAIGLAALVACAPAEQKADAPEGMAPAMTVADFAGTWNATSTLAGVEAPVESQITGTAAGTDWVIMLPNREPIPLQVSVAGDSLIAQSGQYESVLRKGVMVSIRMAQVMHQDMMMGNLVATYQTPNGQEIVTGTTQAVRAVP